MIAARRLMTVAAVVAVVVLVVAVLGAGGSADVYRVRAIFANAASVVPDADVRVAGATVGRVKSLDVTSDNRAAVLIEITNPAFARFYADARCEVRLQSLIGEKFIDCKPGTATEPELGIDPGDKSAHLLPIAQTVSSVDLDTQVNMMRLPSRERLRVILNELGVGVGARGEELNSAIRRLNPALREFDKVLAILARHNVVLARLARDSDRALVHLARERKHIVGTLDHSEKVARATLARREEFRQTMERLPAFMAELEPTAVELRKFAVEAQPVARGARAAAKDFSTFVSNTPELADAADDAFTEFSDATETMRAQVDDLEPLASSLKRFTADARPAVDDLDDTFRSFVDQSGVENLMSLTLGVVGAMNGYDSWGHFMRSAMVAEICFLYLNTRSQSCATNDFGKDRNIRDEPTSSGSGQAAALDYLLGSGR